MSTRSCVKLDADPRQGLSETAARSRLEKHGPNELTKEHKVFPAKLLLNQFKNTLIVILLIATVLSAALGEMVDAVIILVIVIFCAVLGFVQEYRAERALDVLTRMLAPTTGDHKLTAMAVGQRDWDLPRRRPRANRR